MLWEQALLMGFEVIALGKGKNNPVDRGATAESCYDEATAKGMNPKMLAAFQDGTKTMVELAAVSNATGLLPDVPGMHGPKVELEDLVRVFVPAADGGIFSTPGVVDFSTGAIAPGVFAIVRSDEPRIRKEMKFITRAEGPYYLHHRPYHLCDLETPQSIAEAVLLGEVTVASETLHSEVICVAKRDLRAGARLEGIGGHDWYGILVTHADACASHRDRRRGTASPRRPQGPVDHDRRRDPGSVDLRLPAPHVAGVAPRRRRPGAPVRGGRCRRP